MGVFEKSRMESIISKIMDACKTGGIAFGKRWQSAEMLKYIDDCNMPCYFNTIFDKQAFLNGNRQIYKTNSGGYRVYGVEYPT